MANEKIIPSDLDAEQAILCSMLLSKDAIPKALEVLKPEHFYFPENGLIFETISDMFKVNRVADIITVSAELKGKNKLTDAGGQVYLANLLDSSVATANIAHHARIVFEKAIIRSVIDLSQKLAEEAFDNPSDVDALLEFAQKKVMDVANNKIRSRVRGLNEVLSSVFDQLQEATTSQTLNGLATGFNDLDKILTGLKKSELIILAARPSMGKTTFALNIANNAARNGNSVLFFSIETQAEHLGIRLLSADSKIDSQEIQGCTMEGKDMAQIGRSLENLSSRPIFFEDTGALSTLELRAITRQMQMKADIKLIVIDYLTLMTSSARKPESRYHEVSQAVREIKAFAKEAGIPIILLSQLSRENEKRTEKRPNLSDLRESGEIEQTADVVLFLHRDDYYQGQGEKTEESSDVSLTEIIVAKHRNGPTGTAKLMYRKNTSSFYPVEHRALQTARSANR